MIYEIEYIEGHTVATTYTIEIEAESEELAREKFDSGNYDSEKRKKERTKQLDGFTQIENIVELKEDEEPIMTQVYESLVERYGKENVKWETEKDNYSGESKEHISVNDNGIIHNVWKE